MASDLNERMASMFQGNFLDATDLIGKGEVTVTISQVVPPNEEKDSVGKRIDKAILSFQGKQKRLVLNKGNAKVIKLEHGESDQWIGKKIKLTVRLVDAFGEKDLPVIRVVPPPNVKTTWAMRKKFGNPVPEQRAQHKRANTEPERDLSDVPFGGGSERFPGDE